MKDQANKQSSSHALGTTKLRYHAPVLSYFGLVSDLTRSFASDCKSDNADCGPPPENMGRDQFDTTP